MRLAARGDVGFDVARFQSSKVLLAPEAVVQGRRFWRAQVCWQSYQGRFGLGFVVRMVGQATCDDQEALLIYRHLGVVGLLKSGAAGRLHDA